MIEFDVQQQSLKNPRHVSSRANFPLCPKLACHIIISLASYRWHFINYFVFASSHPQIQLWAS